LIEIVGLAATCSKLL